MFALKYPVNRDICSAELAVGKTWLCYVQRRVMWSSWSVGRWSVQLTGFDCT